MFTKIIVGTVSTLLLLGVLSTHQISRPIFEETLDRQMEELLQLAPTDQALTIARARDGTVLLVVGIDKDGITAVDLTAASGIALGDGIEAYQRLGIKGLLSLADAPAVQVAWSNLGMPLLEHYPHAATGTNYRAHAVEVGHEGQPFLFPKLSHATAWDSAVNTGTRLDHEVELCAVPLEEHSRDKPATLGYLLCGDFTDRWTLVRTIDIGGEMGRTGFPAGKGGETRLPVGPLLVIPLEEDFYRQIELSLYVNEALRQRAKAGQMIWTPRQILSNVLADCRSPYVLGAETILIGHCDHISAGTLILTGTPEGVMFHMATLWSPWAYLQEGDVVTSFGTYLGLNRNTISKVKSD
jgi:2-keto-4-pentenoate hydratase/2-oxohepta-3-ene-1,7-dioic acid hydratase in catechol pathway